MKKSIFLLFLLLFSITCNIFCMQKNTENREKKEVTNKKALRNLPAEIVAHKIIPYLISDSQTFYNIYITSTFFKEILDRYYTLNITYKDINKLEPQSLTYKSLFQKIKLEHAFKCPNIKKFIELVVKKIKLHATVCVKYKEPSRRFAFSEKLTYNPILHKNNFEQELLKIFTYKAKRLHKETVNFLDYWATKAAQSPLTNILYMRKRITHQNLFDLRKKFLKPSKHTLVLEKKIAEKVQAYIADAKTKYEL